MHDPTPPNGFSVSGFAARLVRGFEGWLLPAAISVLLHGTAVLMLWGGGWQQPEVNAAATRVQTQLMTLTYEVAVVESEPPPAPLPAPEPSPTVEPEPVVDQALIARQRLEREERERDEQRQEEQRREKKQDCNHQGNPLTPERPCQQLLDCL